MKKPAAGLRTFQANFQRKRFTGLLAAGKPGSEPTIDR